MNTKHTPGEWIAEDFEGDNKSRVIYTTEKPHGIANIYPSKEGEANAQLIAAAPELLQMVYSLMQSIKRLTEDDLTQFDRDTEAQWIGEAHELLLKVNPDYYKNANTHEHI